MEKTFEGYTRFITESLKAETIKNTIASIGRVGHFVKAEDGMLKPIDYPGFTLITPTSGDDTGNSSLFEILLQAQAVIKEKISADKFVKAPANALHMTLARLISGEQFKERILGVRENNLLNALNTLFLSMPAQPNLVFAVKGIAVRHGIIAAMVTAEDEDGYRRLQSFRDAVYEDKALIEFGVERKRGFAGHITLLYIEDELTDAEKAGLAEAVTDMNKAFFSKPHPFYIRRAEVRRFNNYLDFTREKDWPAFRFDS